MPDLISETLRLQAILDKRRKDIIEGRPIRELWIDEVREAINAVAEGNDEDFWRIANQSTVIHAFVHLGRQHQRRMMERGPDDPGFRRDEYREGFEDGYFQGLAEPKTVDMKPFPGGGLTV